VPALKHVNRHGTSVNRSRPGWSRLSAPELSAETAPGHLFAREADEHAGGVELRAGNSNQRYGEVVCAASARVNVSVLYQFVDTANRPWPTSVAPRRGFSRSGSVWLGRSQKDGLPSYRGGTYFIAVQGHQLAHRGGAAWSLPLSNRERE
jgi:hypothetical protein